MKRGKFIVIEGIDGSGKGTVLKSLSQYLYDRDKNNHLFLTREPYITQYATEVRQLLKTISEPRQHAEQFAELFVKDRRAHAIIIEHLLNEGIQVISDRYKHSTLVFQQTQGLSLAYLIDLHRGLIIPDITIIIDVPAEIAMERINLDKVRSHKEVFEQIGFLKLLRENYLFLTKQLPNEHIVIVDGNQSQEQVLQAVKMEVDKIYTN